MSLHNVDEEEGLRIRLAELKESEPAYAAALNDLAVLKLSQGETEEAQRLLSQLRTLRADSLNEQVEDIKQCSAATGYDTAPTQAASTSSRSDMSLAAGSDSRTPSSGGPAASRPRAAGHGGMGGGVTMFARALGGRSPAGARRMSGGATAGAARQEALRSGHGAETVTHSAPGSRSASGPRGRHGSAATDTAAPQSHEPRAAATDQTAFAASPAPVAAASADAPSASGPGQGVSEPQRQPSPLTASSSGPDSAGRGAAAKGSSGACGSATASQPARRGSRRSSYEQPAGAAGPTRGASAQASPAKAAAAPTPPAGEHDSWELGSEDGNSSGWEARGHDYRDYAERGSGADADGGALRATLGDCSHVLEVYGLTTETRSSHLEEFVTVFCTQEGRPLPLVKWVDDHHALLVCPDIPTARCLLQEDQGVFQLRTFAEASAGAKAVSPAELLPPRERPKTNAAVAKLFLSHALGMRQLRDRAAEKDLAQQRKAAKEARREREQKLAAAWDDD